MDCWSFQLFASQSQNQRDCLYSWPECFTAYQALSIRIILIRFDIKKAHNWHSYVDAMASLCSTKSEQSEIILSKGIQIAKHITYTPHVHPSVLLLRGEMGTNPLIIYLCRAKGVQSVV